MSIETTTGFVEFHFDREYSLAQILDAVAECDHESKVTPNLHDNIVVEFSGVAEELIEGMQDDDLCEFFGLETEFLIYTHRTYDINDL